MAFHINPAPSTSAATMILHLFRKDPHLDTASRLYHSLVTQARCPAFYEAGGVPDTVDGRFDMITLHAFLVLRRLKGESGPADALAQSLFDHMFSDMDQALREMGVGDLMVGKRVKEMARAFYGRVEAYDKGLHADEDEALAAALTRNLYRKASPTEAQMALLTSYIRSEAAFLDKQALDDLLSGTVSFGTFPPGSGDT